MKKILTTMLAVLVMGSFSYAQLQYKTSNVKKIPAELAGKIPQHRFLENMVAKPAPRAMVKDGTTTITTFPYEMGFENGLAGWTLIDNDNDGFNWIDITTLTSDGNGTELSHSGNNCLASASYDNATYSALTPDNWLISPAITLNDSYELSWWFRGLDINAVGDNYSVYIATGNTVADFTATTPVLTEVTTTDVWTKRTIDLSSYNGQTIYIAFRHHNCTDAFMLSIDDIKIGEFSAPEISISAPAIARLNETTQFVANVVGANVTFTWDIDGTIDATTTDTLNYVFDIEGNHTVIATATNIHGSSSDTVTVNVVDCSPIIEFPYNDGFEEGYMCWQQVDVNADGMGFTSLAELEGSFGMVETPNSGEEAMVSMSGFVFWGFVIPMPQDNYFISRQISVSSDCPVFGMFAKSIGETADSFAVYATTTLPDTNTVFTADQTLIPLRDANIGSYSLYTADMTPFVGQDVYIVIQHKSVAGAGALIIDDVYLGTNVAPQPVIDAPVDVREGRVATFSARTISAATDVTYSWTFDGAEEPSTVDGDTATATWLTAGTYDVTVSATNDAGTNDTTIQFVVYGCDPITVFPDTTDFSTMTDLRCWDAIDNNNDGSSWYLVPGLGIANNSLNFETEEAITPDDYLVSPTYTIPADGHYEFVYLMQPGDAEMFAEHFSVYVSTTGNAVENFTTPVYEETINAAQQFVRTISLDAYAGQNINIAFRHHNCSGQVGFVVINTIVRAMPAPENVVVTGPMGPRTGDAVTYVATAEGIVDSYAWTVDGVAVSSTTNTMNTTFTEAGEHVIVATATNAVGSTDGTITINAIECSTITEFPYVEQFETGLGCWSEIDNDQDGHSWMLGLPEDGFALGYNESNAAVSYSFDNPTLSALTPDNWLISPAIQLPAEGEYNVSWMASAAANPDYMAEQYSVYVATEGTIDAFTANPAKYNEIIATPDWENHAISLTEYAGQTVYIAFRHHNCTNQFILRIDDVKVQAGHVGIDDVANVEMSLYPNPTTGMITINAEGIDMIQVLDVNGRVVMSQANAGQINMSELSNGVYFVRVITNEGIAIQKVIKH